MSTSYPTSIDTLTNPAGTDPVTSPDHAAQHANANDAIEAIEAKVGVDSSAVTTSHDYKLGEITGSDKALGKSATQTLTNKTLTTPTIGSFANATHNHEAAAGGGQLDEDALALTDVTTNNSSTSKHGFIKKLSNTATEFMNGAGNWAVPGGDLSITIQTTTGVTHSLTTTAGQKVMVWVKGDLSITAAGAQTATVSLKYNTVAKDVVVPYSENVTTRRAFALHYTETPGAATQDITVTTDVGTLANVVILVLIT